MAGVREAGSLPEGPRRGATRHGGGRTVHRDGPEGAPWRETEAVRGPPRRDSVRVRRGVLLDLGDAPERDRRDSRRRVHRDPDDPRHREAGPRRDTNLLVRWVRHPPSMKFASET